MKDLRRARLYVAAVAAVALALISSAAWAACTATFTSDDRGTFPNTLKYDRKTQVLTADLSGLDRGATIFRAELMLKGAARGRRPMKPTAVHPVDQPDKKLKFVPPRFVSLDALGAVKDAVKAGKPLQLKLEATLAGVSRLEVSYLEGKPKAKDIPVVTGLKVTHRKGQSLVVFTEPKLQVTVPAVAPYDTTVKTIEVKPDQAVEPGDVLATVDTTKQEAELAKAETSKSAWRISRWKQEVARGKVRALIAGTVVIPKGAPKPGDKVRARTKILEVVGQLVPGAYPPLANGAQASVLRSATGASNPGVTFRIWRSAEPIKGASVAKATLVGECGFFTGWNKSYHQGNTVKAKPVRYRVTDGGEPVPWGTGIYAHNAAKGGAAHYAVTIAVNGEEDLDALAAGNTTTKAVEEVTGLGEPVLQWIEKPKGWLYRGGPLTRLIYTRWESWGPAGDGAKPHTSFPSNPIDYLVAMGDAPLPPKPAGEAARNIWRRTAWRVDPSPVGLHLHCWGTSLNGGYGWWYNAHRGAVLIASNQIPYDWWTGYHEARGTCKTFGDGRVWPFTMNRTFGFLDWATKQWKEAPEGVRKHWRKLDLTRVFTAGSSMGGSGAPMFAVRHGGRVAWCVAWVGVHVPAESPGFTRSYRSNYGPRNEAITMPDGKTSPWDHFSDVWWLRKNVKADTGFIMASNGKSDGGIGWPQAYKFARALQETRRPHLYNWGPGGHGTRTVIGANFNLDVRTDQTLPAFTNCSLDNDIGTGKMLTKEQREAEREKIIARHKAGGKPVPKKISVPPTDGDPSGAYNRHLWWETKDVVDTPEAWEMTVVLVAAAPADKCNVDLTPRRLQKFATPKGRKFSYTVTHLKSKEVLTKGTATSDEYDLLTLKQIPLRKGNNRVKITPAK